MLPGLYPAYLFNPTIPSALLHRHRRSHHHRRPLPPPDAANPAAKNLRMMSVAELMRAYADQSGRRSGLAGGTRVGSQ